ncbi:DUF1254 domain-containing protein [Nocardia sp. NPDC059764]|uniref:DUF1254 domain-containing protein n=1 Tax=Nocardia sp. NPDC059764 TaxID=3346939 RepID=UPI00365DD794
MTVAKEVSRRSAVKIVGVVAAAAVGLTACGTSSDSTSNSTTSAAAGDIESVATDAYVFGYPLVLMDATRAGAAPVNHFDHARTLPDAANRSIVRMNQDTLYSQAWLDLSSEPIVVQVPAMERGRYWLLQTMDAWTNVTHNPSSVRPQLKSGKTDGPFTYAFTGPGFSGTLPDDITAMPMPTNMAWILGRVQVDGPADLDAVHAIQDQIKIAPLSAWQQNPGTSNPPATATPGSEAARTVADMNGHDFFAKLSTLTAANPPAAADADAMKRFASVGIKPGASVDTLPADKLDAAATAAKRGISTYQNPQAKDENGWQFATNLGTYGTDYPQRANVALLGLGANLPEDAIYPMYTSKPDQDNGPHRYRLHFAAGQLPPVDAFWSITAYAADGYFYDNPGSIYAVGHLIPPTANPDGSVDIAVQNAEPGADVPAGNWLPIPASGPFSLNFRLYAPKSQATNGDWQPPALTPVS